MCTYMFSISVSRFPYRYDSKSYCVSLLFNKIVLAIKLNGIKLTRITEANGPWQSSVKMIYSFTLYIIMILDKYFLQFNICFTDISFSKYLFLICLKWNK